MILLDTSGLLSALFSDQNRHAESKEVIENADRPLVLSPFVLAEVDYLVRKYADVGVELELLDEVASGAYALASFGFDDVGAAARVIDRYRDLDIGLADASIVVLADRAGTTDVLTLDERHFRAMRALNGETFRLLPADR